MHGAGSRPGPATGPAGTTPAVTKRRLARLPQPAAQLAAADLASTQMPRWLVLAP
jgi:hypothetical protein